MLDYVRIDPTRLQYIHDEIRERLCLNRLTRGEVVDPSRLNVHLYRVAYVDLFDRIPTSKMGRPELRALR